MSHSDSTTLKPPATMEEHSHSQTEEPKEKPKPK